MHNKHKTAFKARKIKVIVTFEKQASDLLLKNPSTRDVGTTLRIGGGTEQNLSFFLSSRDSRESRISWLV